VHDIGFTGGWLDRSDHSRGDAGALAAARADWRARLLVLARGEPDLDAAGHLRWTTLADVASEDELIFLGLDAGGRPHFAPLTADSGVGAQRSPALFRMLDQLRSADAAVFGTARVLADWHARHRFCARCGTATAPIRGGWARRCPGCGTEHFPRVDPVVIMLAEHEDRVLVGRQAAWPPRRYSALAGFVEPGESIEEAVAREVLEEAGVHVRDVRYVASQPWPFPGQLMIGCFATATDSAITVDANELEDAIWATRAEVRAALAGEPSAPFLPPPPYAIARTLLGVWAR
jgi:NAD+ diphosphatase